MKTFYMSSTNILNAVRWVARTNTVLLIIIVVILFIEQGGLPTGEHFSGLKLTEALIMGSTFFAFPGLLIAWKWEGFGAILTIAALITFSTVDYFSSGGVLWNIWVVGIPALLFLFCWWHTNYSRYNRIYRS